MDCNDNRGDTALARRLYLHVQAGGQITAEDMGRMVEALERRDATLSPLIRHSDAHEFAPPISFSVDDCRKIKEKING